MTKTDGGMGKERRGMQTDRVLKAIYDVTGSDGRKHYILFDRRDRSICPRRRPEWCRGAGGTYDPYPYCPAERPAPRKIWRIIAAAAGGRRLAGMCTAVMYPGMCARCARKTGYNISPIAAADRLFAVKDDEMARRTLLDAGGMVFT